MGCSPEHAVSVRPERRISSHVSMSVLDQANNSRRLVNADDDSDVSSLTTPIQLCSAGFLVEFEVTAFHSRFTD